MCVSGRQCKYDRFVIVCDHYRQDYSESCVGQVVHGWPGPCVILYLISRRVRPEGPAAFANNHIPSQVGFLGPSRAPQSLPPISPDKRKGTNKTKEREYILLGWPGPSADGMDPRLAPNRFLHSLHSLTSVTVASVTGIGGFLLHPSIIPHTTFCSGCPDMTQSGWGQGRGHVGGVEKPPLPWPFGPHVAG